MTRLSTIESTSPSRKSRVRLAGPDDDAALRAMLGQVGMPGPINLALTREPGFLCANLVGYTDSQTIVHEDADGTIVGMGTRSIHPAYLDGAPVDVSYLSQLRAVPGARGGMALARGYAALRGLIDDGRTSLTYTTILDENVEATKILTSGRAGLPTYKRIGTLVTHLIPIRARRSRASIVTDAQRSHFADAVEAVDHWNRRHSLAPHWTVDRVRALRDFDPANWYVDVEGDRIVGTFGVWDQSGFKQTVVTGYRSDIKIARPFYNAAMHVLRMPGLPEVGCSVRMIYGVLMSAVDDDPQIFARLLNCALGQWSGRGFDYLAVGFCQGHPLEVVVRSTACRTLSSGVYRVYWRGENLSVGKIHLEVSLL